MKNILHYGKQVIIFIACAVAFSASVFSVFIKDGAPSSLSLLSKDAYYIRVIYNSSDDSESNSEKVKYSSLYSLFESQPDLTVIKPYKGSYFTGLQIYSTDSDFSLKKYTDDNTMFSKSENLMIYERDIQNYLTVNDSGEAFLILNGEEHLAKGFYTSGSIYDYAFISNLYSFNQSDRFIAAELFYVDCGNSTDEFVKKVESLFSSNGNYQISVRSAAAYDESNATASFDAESAIIVICAVFMIIIICFGSVIYIKIMLGKRSKEIFCKYLCGAELPVIQGEFIKEFIAIAAIGSAAGIVLSLIFKLWITIKLPCLIISAVLIPILIFLICFAAQKTAFPKENELQRRIRE